MRIPIDCHGLQYVGIGCRGAFALSLALALASLGTGAMAAAGITVSAAASLTDAFREVGQGYTAAHPGTLVRFNFAASDVLVRQCAQGAPVDVLATADQVSMDRAAAEKLLVPGSRRDFASNRLVLVVPADGAPSQAGLALAGLADLQSPAVKRIAMGNPASVPVGRYALSVLQAAHLWPALEAKVIHTLSVRQALDYVARGEVDAGFVYATDAALRQDQVRVALEPPTAIPILYPVAEIADKARRAEAKGFIDYLLSPAGQAILGKYGFGKP
jgi:molybdate transport system substrate-binding protein